MPQRLYTAADMGGGLQVVNSPNPVSPQDLATKSYVDSYRNQFGPYVPLWEADYYQPCASATYTNATIHMTSGLTDQSVTRLYADTAIRVIVSLTCYVNVSSAQIQLMCAVNGKAAQAVCGLWLSTASEHTAFPVGIKYFPASYLGATTGAMTVAWYMFVSNATTTVSTDSNDHAAWTIAECKTS